MKDQPQSLGAPQNDWERVQPGRIGLAGALALGRVVSKLVFGVSPADPATFAAVSALLAAVALAASIIPAWRATRVEPVKTLREE